MPDPDQVRDDGSGIQSILESLDSGLRRIDPFKDFQTFYETINSTGGEIKKFFAENSFFCEYSNRKAVCGPTKALTVDLMIWHRDLWFFS